MDMLKQYVFEEYRDSWGIGREMILDTEEQAIKYAKQEWEKLSEDDKNSYKNDVCGTFRVYEIEISEDQLEEYNVGTYQFSLHELWTKDIVDMLDR